MRRAIVQDEEESSQKLQDLKSKMQKQITEEESQDSEELNMFPRQIKRQCMYTAFDGVIETGVFKQHQSLVLFYTISAGKDWDCIQGQASGMSQNAFADEDRIVWNFPFSIGFQTKYPLRGWPQITIILYGKDFFGRSTVKAYGNTHLPMQEGSHNRKIRTFQSIPQTTIANCCSFFIGYINQYKNAEKVLTQTQDRQLTKVRTNGQVKLKVNVKRYNFNDYGYQ